MIHEWVFEGMQNESIPIIDPIRPIGPIGPIRPISVPSAVPCLGLRSAVIETVVKLIAVK